jgi:uncharacterized protein YaiL (DUF2058 family)
MSEENADWKVRYDALQMDVHRIAVENASLKARNQVLEAAAQTWEAEKKTHQLIFQQRMDQMNADLQSAFRENGELKEQIRALKSSMEAV